MTQSLRPQRFSAGAITGLRQAIEPGEPLRVDITLIDPDPGQPRRVFQDDEIAALAASMTIKQGDDLIGVLSPIGVRKGQGGRWNLTYGERRLRAAKMAGFTTIPVVVVPNDQTTLAVQVIENQHRSNLANSDLTRVIMTWTESGMSNDAIAKITNLAEHEVKYYRVLAKLPDFMMPWLDKGSARALYEIHQVWKKGDLGTKQLLEKRLAALPGEELTLAEARRVIEHARSAAATSTDPEPTIGRTPRMRAAEKIDRLTATISALLEMIREDRVEEARDLVAAVMVETQISTPDDLGNLRGSAVEAAQPQSDGSASSAKFIPVT